MTRVVVVARRRKVSRRHIPVARSRTAGRVVTSGKRLANVIGPFPHLYRARRRRGRMLKSTDRISSVATSGQCIRWHDATFGTAAKRKTAACGHTRIVLLILCGSLCSWSSCEPTYISVGKGIVPF